MCLPACICGSAVIDRVSLGRRILVDAQGFIGRAVKVPAAAALLVVFVGEALLGLFGALIAVSVAAATIYLLTSVALPGSRAAGSLTAALTGASARDSGA